MSNYVQITSFAPKDALLTGNPAKLIKGSEFDPEFAAIAVAIATKYDATNIGSAPVEFNGGSTAAPGVTFTGDTDTGLFRSAANTTGLSTNALARLTIDTTSITTTLPFYMPDGSAANPAAAFSADTDVGIYRVTTNALGFSTSGTRRAYVDATTWVMEVPTYFTDGSAGSPSASFATDTNSGMYRFGADQIGFSTAGTHRMLVSTLGVHVDSGTLFIQDGSVGSPSLAFASDTNTGLYKGASDIGLLVAGGSEGLRWSTQGAGFIDGSAGSPSLFFSQDSNTGFYRATTDQLFFSEGGTGYRIGYRKVPEFSQNAGYTFQAADVGQSTAANSAGNFTIPPSVFSAGDVFMFVNTTGSNCTLVQGSGVTIRLLGTAATTGNRTVGSFGMATIYCQTSTVFLVSGPNVT